VIKIRHERHVYDCLLPTCLKKQSTGLPALRKDKGTSNECLYLAISDPNRRNWMFRCMYFVSVSACILGLVGGSWAGHSSLGISSEKHTQITMNCEDSSHIRFAVSVCDQKLRHRGHQRTYKGCVTLPLGLGSEP
jgi:hypothetical protein